MEVDRAEARPALNSEKQQPSCKDSVEVSQRCRGPGSNLNNVGKHFSKLLRAETLLRLYTSLSVRGQSPPPCCCITAPRQYIHFLLGESG